jgi:hypothetical protein
MKLLGDDQVNKVVGETIKVAFFKSWGGEKLSIIMSFILFHKLVNIEQNKN